VEIALLESGGVDEVSLDHDLGLRAEVGDGYQVLLQIAERVHEGPGYVPPTLHVHSSNLGARERPR